MITTIGSITTAITTRRNLIFNLAASAIILPFLPSVGSAATPNVPRAFVSTTGSDNNPCSATLPCRSFNQALTVVEPGGEIVVQNSGGYSTGFIITQSVTIDAAGFNASVINIDSSDLCTISAGPSDRVILRGISFHGAGNGNNAINVTQLGSLYVEHCSFAEIQSQCIQMLGGGNLWVKDTEMRRCSQGIAISSSAVAASLVVQSSNFSECGTGVVLDANGTMEATGLMSNCSATLCTGGFIARSDSSANAELTLTNCRAYFCGEGLETRANSTGNVTVRLANCILTGNGFGIQKFTLSSGGVFILGTTPASNLVSGNTFGNALGGAAVALQ